jgi:methionyl-tRNA formyltransferase
MIFQSNGYLKNIVFMGTPVFASEFLSFLLEARVPITAVFTQEDAISSRGTKKLPPPVKQVAQAWNLPVYQPKSVNSGEGYARLESIHPDMVVLVAFGKLLKKNVLDLPSYGAFNIHPSLLPRYRGAAPIRRCLLAGDEDTGVCVMKMVKELDAGPIADCVRVAIDPNDSYDLLVKKIHHFGKTMLLRFLSSFDPASTVLTEQDSSQPVVYAGKIEKEELRINWKLSAEEVHNRIRAFDSDPLAKSVINGISVKLAGSTRQELETSDDTEARPFVHRPGEIVSVSSQGAQVACGTGYVRISLVQFPGKKKISAYQAYQGRLIKPGDIFEETP